MRKLFAVLGVVSSVVGLTLSILTLPSVPEGVAGWGEWLAWVDNSPARWLLPVIGWIAVAAGFCALAWLHWSARKAAGATQSAPASVAQQASTMATPTGEPVAVSRSSATPETDIPVKQAKPSAWQGLAAIGRHFREMDRQQQRDLQNRFGALYGRGTKFQEQVASHEPTTDLLAELRMWWAEVHMALDDEEQRLLPEFDTTPRLPSPIPGVAPTISRMEVAATLNEQVDFVRQIVAELRDQR